MNNQEAAIQFAKHPHVRAELRASIVSIVLIAATMLITLIMQPDHARTILLAFMLGALMGWNIRTLVMECYWLRE